MSTKQQVEAMAPTVLALIQAHYPLLAGLVRPGAGCDCFIRSDWIDDPMPWETDLARVYCGAEGWVTVRVELPTPLALILMREKQSHHAVGEVVFDPPLVFRAASLSATGAISGLGTSVTTVTFTLHSGDVETGAVKGTRTHLLDEEQYARYREAVMQVFRGIG